MERLGSSYILEERIGAGAQGDVWKGHKEGSEEPLAFKKLKRNNYRLKLQLGKASTNRRGWTISSWQN